MNNYYFELESDALDFAQAIGSQFVKFTGSWEYDELNYNFGVIFEGKLSREIIEDYID